MDGSQGWRLAVGDVGLADVGCGMGELSPGWFGCADADAGAEAHGGDHCHTPAETLSWQAVDMGDYLCPACNVL